ncbi:MAG: hypothetical protein HOP18_26130 [Deltaproteobacteria bacterium]|nr:hypothetical protein [Deltaproteobacteria bacterium]
MSILLFPSSTRAQEAPLECTPGINFAKLLDNVTIGYVDAKVRLGTLYAVCLPVPTTPSDSPYPYNPDDGEKLTTLIKRADGTVLTTYVWYAEHISGLWELSRYKVLGGDTAVKSLTAGDYLLEFTIAGKPFSRLPFTVTELPSDDPYQPPGTRYFLEGAWNSYANLFYQRNDPQSSFRFTVWLQDKQGKESKRSVPYTATIVRTGDGTVVAQDEGTLRLEPRWLKADLLFHPANGDKNAYTKAEEVLREDGGYSVRLSLDGKPYGTYPFTVKDHTIQMQGHQRREGTDPVDAITDYISGGRYRSWWITKTP